MAVGREERERQLDDLRKEIGGRLDPDDKEAEARLKDSLSRAVFQDD